MPAPVELQQQAQQAAGVVLLQLPACRTRQQLTFVCSSGLAAATCLLLCYACQQQAMLSACMGGPACALYMLV
jgi:hypothetical protein